jgi:antitoxin VapB
VNGKTTEFETKFSRIAHFLEDYNYDAIIIGTTANFAWATCGGDDHILLDAQGGSGLLVFTKHARYCIANKMDARRLAEQELEGFGFEIVSLKWFETPITEYALNLLRGKRILSDIPLPGTDCNFSIFYKLHYPMTDQEIERYRQIGRDAETAVVKVAECISKGSTGYDVQTAVLYEFAKRQLAVACMIVGIDEEMKIYRHPLPKDQVIGHALMLVLAGKRYGLNVPITRMIYFEDVPEDIQKRYQAVCTIEANTILSCKAGKKFYDLSMMQKAMYKELGYEKEWEEHYVGGITGYTANDGSFCVDKLVEMTDRQTFNWYVTITGVNVEETMACIGDTQELFTVTGLWPAKEYQVGGKKVSLPQILIKK